MIAVLDSSALYATLDVRDSNHGACLAVLRRPDVEFVIPTLVVGEVSYLLGARAGPLQEESFLRSLSEADVESPSPDDWPIIADYVRRYSNFPLGGTDASVAVLAQRLGTDIIITLDRRHFGVVRTAAGRPFTLLP